MKDEAGHHTPSGQSGGLPLDVVAFSSSVMPRSAIAPISPAGLLAPAVLHLLVVDEIAMNRDIAASFLRAAGHKVTCVEGGAEAIAAVKATNFNVVLMDVRMPEMDGLEATRRIRALENVRALERDRFGSYATGSHRIRTAEGVRAHVPIVALTARAFTEQVAECHEAGMDSHVPKPFTPDTLLSAVLRAVAIVSSDCEDPTSESGPDTAHDKLVLPMIGARKLVLDQAVFERTALFLPPEVVTIYVRAIAERAQGLLQELSGPDRSLLVGDDLAEAAHTIAGIAGMFGFERLTYLGCRFERAIECQSTEIPAVASSLRAALEDTLNVIHNRRLAISQA